MGNNIRKIRMEKGMRLKDVADPLNTSPNQIGYLETGQRKLSQEWMVKIAGVLGCSPAELIASSEIVEPVTTEHEKTKVHVIDSEPTAIDELALSIVIQLLEETLDRTSTKLPYDKKAEVIILMYEIIVEDEEKGVSMAKKMLNTFI